MNSNTLYRITEVPKHIVDVSGVTVEDIEKIKQWFLFNGFDITKKGTLDYALSKPITFQPILRVVE